MLSKCLSVAQLHQCKHVELKYADLTAFRNCTMYANLFFLLIHVLGCGADTDGKAEGARLENATKFVMNSDESLNEFSGDYNPTFYAIIGTLCVGLTGVFPLLVIPVEDGQRLREGVSADTLKLWLSFAVGALLGDVFLHLLPEAFASANAGHDDNTRIGLWIIGGIVVCLTLAKIFKEEAIEQAENSEKKTTEETNHICNGNNPIKEIRKEKIKVEGCLNLFANCVDNFTHGLAVSASFLISRKVGLLTTFAILLHEIPHEIGDFAILLKSGFRRKDAALGQVITATGGLIGAVFGLYSKGANDSSGWVLPFTSGSFIYIALVTIIPDLLQELRGWESVKQLLCLVTGIVTMGAVSLIH